MDGGRRKEREGGARIAFALPYGYVIGVVIGTVIAYVMKDRLASTDEHK